MLRDFVITLLLMLILLFPFFKTLEATTMNQVVGCLKTPGLVYRNLIQAIIAGNIFRLFRVSFFRYNNNFLRHYQKIIISLLFAGFIDPRQ